MQFADEPNGQDLITVCDDYAHTDSISYPIEKKVRAANMGNRMIWSWIYFVYGGWIFDDSNQTDIPEAKADLVSGQQIYVLPTGSADLKGVAYKDSAGNWNQLDPITLEEIQEREPENEFNKTPGAPIFYRPIANGFKIYPASDSNRTQAIGIFIGRDVVSFVVTDDTKKPGFDSIFHEALAVFMALYHAKTEQLAVLKTLSELWDGNEDQTGREGGYKLKIKQYYGDKFKQLVPKVIRKRPNVVDQYVS